MQGGGGWGWGMELGGRLVEVCRGGRRWVGAEGEGRRPGSGWGAAQRRVSGEGVTGRLERVLSDPKHVEGGRRQRVVRSVCSDAEDKQRGVRDVGAECWVAVFPT